MHPLLKLENITWTVDEKPVLHDISFELAAGTKLGIAGESGSGKTTLAKIITELIAPGSGKITISSGAPKKHKVLMLFQNNGELIHPFRKAGDILSEAVQMSGESKRGIQERMSSIISLVGINPALLERKGCHLSGGEQQRVALARLLAFDPEILIVDEPFSSQDPGSAENFTVVLNEVVEKKKLTLICISHDLRLLSRFADEIMILHQGSIVERAPAEVIMTKPSHPYTQFLVNASSYRS